MTEPTPVTIGADVSCTDGDCGNVTRVVVDPVARTVTHLVVEPKHRIGLGRLVPLDLVDATAVDATAGEIRLRCTMAEFEKLDSAEETQFVPGTYGYAAYGPEQVVSWPYYGLGGVGLSGETIAGISQTAVYDTVPLGEVEVRRGEHVHATDGNIGRVQGLVIDPRSHHVTHVLLQEGHLWGSKEVAIPISAVTEVDDDGIKLTITKQQIQDLPPVDIDHPAGP
jgi:sporulation protein YlmC with PRC-barrel domain